MSFDIPQIPQQHLFLLFLLYSFVGWVCEEIWVSTLYRKIEKRGMLAGSVCPIYGFGALIILFAVYPWRGTWVRLFIASAVCASALEYFSSWLLETLFHTKWWDYSKQRFNLNGRVCPHLAYPLTRMHQMLTSLSICIANRQTRLVESLRRMCYLRSDGW